MPSVRTRTRSPERPRRTGAEAVGPKLVALTPGWRAKSLADAGADFASEIRGIEDGDPAEHVGRALADAGDDDVVAMVVMRVLGGAGLRRFRRSSCGCGAGGIDRYVGRQDGNGQSDESGREGKS